MLGSIFSHIGTIGSVIILSAVLSSCGGTLSSESDSVTPGAAIQPGDSSISSQLNATSSAENVNSVATTNKSNSNTLVSNSSVRNLTYSSIAQASSSGGGLSGTIDRSTSKYSSSGIQTSSPGTSLSGTIDRSIPNVASSAASRDIKLSSSAVNSSKASSLANSSKASSQANSSKASSLASSSKASSLASSSKTSSLASSSKTSSLANSSKASSQANSSKASSLASSSKASSLASSSKTSSSASSSKTSSLASSSKASDIAGLTGATIQWSHPTARENGTYLNLDEIGGYQIRYKALNEAGYSYISISGNGVTRYKFPLSIVGLQFEIAVYDRQGLYSNFVPIPSN